MKRLLTSFLILSLTILRVNSVLADEYEDLQKEKEQKLQEKQTKEQEKVKAQKERQSIGGQINDVASQLNDVESQLKQKKTEIGELETNRSQTQQEQDARSVQRASLVRTLYKNLNWTPLILFLTADGFSQLSRIWSYFDASTDETREQIQNLGAEITDLQKNIDAANEHKQRLENDVKGLDTQKSQLSLRQGQLTSYQNELIRQISGLEGDIQNISVRQEELIRQKLAATAFFTSVGDMERAVETLPPPPFSPAFAVFSYGYPHRVGMNQYGAYGRAKAGQSAEQILKAYYNGVEIVDYSEMASINVDGYGPLDFEGIYLKGIAEMPVSWGDSGGMEALKAQAIAARTYAIEFTKNGQSSICATQSCQVYRPGKAADSASALWAKAVDETRGKVLVYNGAPIKAWYSSTDGGYTRLPTDFDVKWNSSAPFIKRVKDTDAEGKAYDGPAYGASPWFHRAWYDPATDGNPWLSKEDLLDLLNAALLPDSYNPNLSQEVPVTSTTPGWSKAQVRDALKSLGVAPIEDIGEIKVAQSEEGYTQLIRVSTSDGTRDVDGRRFRQIFSLRSRGRLALWSSLYDIVRL